MRNASTSMNAEMNVTPFLDVLLVLMSGLIPLGAFLPRRESLALPAVGTRRRIRNDAALWVVKVTEEAPPLGIVSSKKTLPGVAATASAGRASPTTSEATASRTTGSYALGLAVVVRAPRRR